MQQGFHNNTPMPNMHISTFASITCHGVEGAVRFERLKQARVFATSQHCTHAHMYVPDTHAHTHTQTQTHAHTHTNAYSAARTHPGTGHGILPFVSASKQHDQHADTPESKRRRAKRAAQSQGTKNLSKGCEVIAQRNVARERDTYTQFLFCFPPNQLLRMVDKKKKRTFGSPWLTMRVRITSSG